MKNTLYSQINELYSYISREKKLKLSGLILLMVIVSISEIISIGLIFPLIGILLDKQGFFEKIAYTQLLSYLQIRNSEQLFDFIIILFCGTVVASGIIRSLYIYLGSKLAFSISSEIGKLVYKRMINSKYQYLINLNSSYIIDSIYNRSNIIANAVVLQSIYLINSLIMTSLFFLVFVFSSIGIHYFIYVFCILLFLYLVVIKITNKSKTSNAKIMSDSSQEVIKILNETFGSIRDIIIGNRNDIFVEIFSKVESKWRNAQANNQFLALSPKYIIESIGICVIVLAIFFLEKEYGAEGINIPAFAAVIFGAQKLIPLFQQAYSAIISIQVSRPSLNEILKILNDEKILFKESKVEKINFNKRLEFRNVNFSYNKNSPLILIDINLQIKPGDRIGILGKSGSGKSTFSDLLMTLLEPTCGSIFIDEKVLSPSMYKGYRQLISHISQTIFLVDDSIIKNIAFGINDEYIDYKKIMNAVKVAELTSDINGFKEGINTIVGDRGCKLSGGQKQRIAIARAIYEEKKILILDEATSALDVITEKKIIDNINFLNKNITLIIITHRISTLIYCNHVYEISNSKLNPININ